MKQYHVYKLLRNITGENNYTSGETESAILPSQILTNVDCT